MTSCPSDEKLTGLLAEVLSPTERDDLARHVDGCALCQEQLARLTVTPDATKWKDGVPFDNSSAEEKLMRRLKQKALWLPPTVPTPGVPTQDKPIRNSLHAGNRKSAAACELPSVPGYEILGELGRGGMGVVYQARQIGLQRIVALKMVLNGNQAGPKYLARFRAEAEAIGRLQHPNIVQIYDVGEAEGRPYFVFEFVAGGNLAQYLRGTPQPVRPAAQLVETLARAVHAAHAKGVIHRDLKPANILLSRSSTDLPDPTDLKHAGDLSSTESVQSVKSVDLFCPKITDFGLAK
ncbi:MAG TPA: serine/threonine-protein kinase, partial [Gemmataceae bacterium]|nr:serine/threonine-protein kinase [Gemmataceae bacterium]